MEALCRGMLGRRVAADARAAKEAAEAAAAAAAAEAAAARRQG